MKSLITIAMFLLASNYDKMFKDLWKIPGRDIYKSPTLRNQFSKKQYHLHKNYTKKSYRR